MIPLVDGPVTIGRRHRDDDPPATIDLGGDRADPGVSRHHATIERDGAGTWSLMDVGSTNGTTVDDDDRPIPPHVPLTIGDGSRIHVGAWTTITIRAAARLTPTWARTRRRPGRVAGAIVVIRRRVVVDPPRVRPQAELV